MIHRLFVACAATLSLSIGIDAVAERPISVDPDRQLDQLRADIKYLASDELRGRSVDDDTIHEAAEYIADRMSSIGLDTMVFDESPFQELPVNLGARAKGVENNHVTISSDDGKFVAIEASLGERMNPMAIGSGSGEVPGKLVFAGYGITAPKLDYDDYKGIDAKGAVVIVLRKEPQTSDPSSRFNGTRNTRHAFFATKIANAIEHGASAVILVNDPASVLQSVMNVRSKISRESERQKRLAAQIEKLPADATNNRKTLNDRVKGSKAMIESLKAELTQAKQGVMEITDAGERLAGTDSVPVVSVARDVIDQVLTETTGVSLVSREKAIDETGSPQSASLPATSIVLKVELAPTVAQTSNVIGVIAGRGELADQSLIVGAHYDHVGMGGYGSLAPGTIAVHNGADDNASGTAAMLATAARMKAALAEEDSHRQVVFIAFTGEERGLVGSRYYVRNPRYPLQSTVAMVNLDMVGRLRDNELTVYGTGSGDSLDALVEQANQVQQFSLYKVATGYGPSDHQSFYEFGVPVLFFFTGLHNDYHRPTDDFDKIDFGDLTRITDIVSDVTFELAVRQERPQYVETENRVRVRRQLTAFMGVTLSDRGDHVAISGLTAGGPAERGGIQVGDRLQKLGGRRVVSSSAVLEAMRNRSPGQKLQLIVDRNGETVQVTVQLTARPVR